MNGHRKSASQGGFVLVTVLLVSLVLAIFVFGTSVTAMLDRQIATSERTSTHAYYVAKAGVARLETALFQSLQDAYSSGLGGVCGIAIPETLDIGGTDPVVRGGSSVSVEFGDHAHALSYDISEDGLIYLRSTGVVGPATQTVQVVADIGPGPAGVYDNAIFATNVVPGSGKLAGTISAYGSIHIVNADLELEDPNAFDAIDASGSAGIYNNYAGNLSNANKSVSDEAMAVFANLDMRSQDLCTRVKIAQGNLEISTTNQGSGTRIGADGIGDPNPNAIKGIYLGDGNLTSKGKVIPGTTTEELESHYAYSRSPVGPYGGAYALTMPTLPAAYPPEDSLEITDSTCEWIRDGALVLPPPDDAPSPLTCGGTYTDPDTGGTTYVPDVLTWDEGILNIGGAKSIAFPSSGLNVTGDVKYNGSAHFMFGNNDTTNGVVKGAVSLKGQLLPAQKDYLTGSTLALTTNGTAEVNVSAAPGSNADPVVAAILYAAESIAVEQSVAVFGSLVSDSVTTKAVPSVAHNNGVRDVAEALCLYGSECRGKESGANDGILTKMTEENL